MSMLSATTEPAKFSPGILSVFIICLVLYCAVFVLTYSYYFNNSQKLYQKMKIRPSTVVLISLMIVLFLVLSIWLSVDKSKSNYFSKNQYMLPMSWIVTCMATIHLLLIIFINKWINQKKRKIENFRNEDFQAILDDLHKNKPSDEYLNKFKEKNKRYYSILEQKYVIINTVLDQYKNEMYTEVLTSLIIFNDTETTRWCKKANYLQLEMFLNLCIKLQQKAKI